MRCFAGALGQRGADGALFADLAEYRTEAARPTARLALAGVYLWPRPASEPRRIKSAVLQIADLGATSSEGVLWVGKRKSRSLRGHVA